LQQRHDIAGYLKEQLEQLPIEKSLYATWLKTTVEPPRVVGWIDETVFRVERLVAKKWGTHATARVWNIINAGFDGEVEQVHNLKPHQLPITSRNAVPGACAPVRNLFHVSQALGWIARTRNTIPERLEYVKAIPQWMEPLTEVDEPPRGS